MVQQTPTFVLTIAYWLHMLATVVWVGGLAALMIIVLPAARKTLSNESYAGFLGVVQIRLQQMGWFSLLLLVATGMFQMVAHPAYEGFLAVTSPWAAAILIKHLTIGLMIAVSAYVTWVLTPAMRRLALRRSVGGAVDEAEIARLLRRETLFLRLNGILAVIILALTAWARALS